MWKLVVERLEIRSSIFWPFVAAIRALTFWDAWLAGAYPSSPAVFVSGFGLTVSG